MVLNEPQSFSSASTVSDLKFGIEDEPEFTSLDASTRERRREEMSAAAENKPEVLALRHGKGVHMCRIPDDDDAIRELSSKWSYVVWKRRRWREDEKLLGLLAAQAVQDLERFDICGMVLEQIADSEIVEVGLSHTRKDLWELPWEFLLAVATSARRTGRNLLVIRRLIGLPEDTDIPAQARTEGQTRLPLLFVMNAPGRLRGKYLFDTEYKLVRRALDLHQDETAHSISTLDSPTLAKFQKVMQDSDPLIVHLSGIDTREGKADINPDDRSGWCEPGIYFQRNPSDTAAGPPDSASTLNPCQRPAEGATAEYAHQAEEGIQGDKLGPACKSVHLVSVNCNYSSTLAAHAVRSGAAFAIGFQDEADMPLMELFFASFYRGLLDAGEFQPERVLRNLWFAMEAMRREKLDASRRNNVSDSGTHPYQLRGTGIVLWTRKELVLKRPAAISTGTGNEQRITVPALHDGGARSLVQCDVRPEPALNYSLLHNDRSIFKRFALTTEAIGTVFDVNIEVHLECAGTRHSYLTSLDLRDFYANVDRIRISLTSDLLRGLSESVYSSMHVAVRCQGQTIHQNTHRVLLLPINEWKDDALNGAWLPSFVLPNDPAVVQVIRAAEKYLQTIADKTATFFDGYQRVLGTGDCQPVHDQVKAIWNALLHDFRTGYINPLPVFQKQSQRLRTPSQVLAEEHGTCIDLSLLFAACLEHVDIYPVLFLLTGHAFVGYFSNPAAHDDFSKLFQSYFDIPWNERINKAPQPWMLERDARREIVKMVRSGQLVPLEATFLSDRGGFADAIRQGARNLSDPARFESVFDIRRARANNVIPLPLGGAQ